MFENDIFTEINNLIKNIPVLRLSRNKPRGFCSSDIKENWPVKAGMNEATI